MSAYPKIYLAMDNCVFYKRFTTPDAWARKVHELGVKYIEASADTELDPLFMGRDYLASWKDAVQLACAKHDVAIANLYSGHGTYSTLGLTHTDARVRRNMIENWFFPMVKMAGELGAGIGFFAHGFAHEILQSEESYQNYVDILVDGLSEINAYGAETGCRELAIEQMYTPHQYPWRLQDTKDLISRVTEKSGKDFYFTEDLGHHHIKFVRPDKTDLENVKYSNIWLGSDRAYEIYKEKGAAAFDEISAEMDAHHSLFAKPEDGDCYRTLRTLGCYSPIIHLQQTNGQMSVHLPFTKEENAKGIIEPKKVLAAIKEAYDAPEEAGMPKRCEHIFLTLELFSGTTSIMENILDMYHESVDYWRAYIPTDGQALDALLH